MARRVWVIAKKDEVEQSDIDDAILNGCPEIANGIPPVLQDVISEEQLPIAYEEPTSPPSAEVNLIVSEPPLGKCKVSNIFVDPSNGKLTVEYDDTPI